MSATPNRWPFEELALNTLNERDGDPEYFDGVATLILGQEEEGLVVAVNSWGPHVSREQLLQLLKLDKEKALASHEDKADIWSHTSRFSSPLLSETDECFILFGEFYECLVKAGKKHPRIQAKVDAFDWVALQRAIYGGCRMGVHDQIAETEKKIKRLADKKRNLEAFLGSHPIDGMIELDVSPARKKNREAYGEVKQYVTPSGTTFETRLVDSFPAGFNS
jgi:hypothetical protein